MSSSTQTQAATEPATALSRRRLFAGAGTVGALAAAASVLPLARPDETVAAQAEPAGEAPGGYRVTEHIQHYYQTARV
jgi:hypothetical protein